MWYLKTRALAVPVLVSTMVFALVGAALPDVLGVTLFYAASGTALALAWSVVEPWAVRLFGGAKALSPAERRILEPVLEELVDRDLGSPDFYTSRRATAPVRAIGRRSVVIDPVLVEALAYGQLTRAEAVGVIGHAAVAVRLGLTRYDLLVAYWTTPWRCLAVVHSPRRGPLRFAWKLRGVVAAVAVVRTLQDEISTRSVVTASLVLALLALTYLVPRWQDRWERAALSVADEAVRDHGLGPSLAAFLRRCPPSTELAARIHESEDIDGERERPHLRLIPGG